jgi:hypothetical protein
MFGECLVITAKIHCFMNEPPQQPSFDFDGHPTGLSTPPIATTHQWKVIGKSVQGASHKRSGQLNQDAILWGPPSGAGSQLILALSDGHGSAKSFRSQHGAEFAVKACIEECSVLLHGQDGPRNLSAIKRTATEHLPQRIVRRWKALVDKHLLDHPVSQEDIDRAVKGATTPTDEAVFKENHLVWYGATLLAVVITDAFVVYLQLGDGDILTVSDSGEVRRPIPPDDRLLGNDTTSFCSANAWQDFRVVFHALSHAAPALIMLSTDGYINSFTDAGEFLKVGTDLLTMIRSAGIEAVKGKLEGWLAEASQQGSGDDITLGIVCRTAASEECAQTLPEA